MLNYAEILIIDDMSDQIALFSKVLHAEGYRVFAATTGKAARHFLENRVPHLILLDFQMSDVSGLEICQKVKMSSKVNDVPVIFVTSETDLETINQGFELGASDYIKMPFVKEEFLARIRTQLRVSVQRKELMNVNEELMQFCSVVTHDLKAPFNIINMLIGMLRQELGDEQPQSVNEIMNMISAKADQARIMIERLFEFSKMYSIEPCRTKVDVKAITTEIFADLRSLVPERDIQFTCTKLPFIVADEALVRMAMKNLLQNAIKYTSKKEKAIIRVSAVHDPSYYVIKVKDNGAGFDMQYVGRIFDVFERLHSAEDFPGTGVGLALVNRIMLRHNGHIDAHGEVDKGAEFLLYFPKNVKPTAAKKK